MLINCFFIPRAPYRYDILSDGLEDVAVDNNMNAKTTLEDEEALDAIDDDSDIWQGRERDEPAVADKTEHKYKLRRKDLARPYAAYEPLNNNCDSLKTWSITRLFFFIASASKATSYISS